MNPVVQFNGYEPDHINEDRLLRTLRLVPRESSSVSYGELLSVLEAENLKPDDIEAIFKVSASDPSYSLLVAYPDTADKLRRKKVLKDKNLVLDVMMMNEQIVNIRVHWLPIYYDGSILREIFAEYGEVLDIKMNKTSHAKLTAFNGQREVRLKCDEFRKQRIPHLINFQSGQSILITLPGRLPFCLRCSEVGHVRGRCPDRLRGYASAVTRRPTRNDAMPADAPAPPDAPQSQAGVVSGSNIGDPGNTQAPAAVGTGSDGAVGSGQVQQQTKDMEIEMASSKRGREQEPGGDDFISPNKTAKGQSWAPEPTPTENPFFLLSVEELVIDSVSNTPEPPQ